MRFWTVLAYRPLPAGWQVELLSELRWKEKAKGNLQARPVLVPANASAASTAIEMQVQMQIWCTCGSSTFLIANCAPCASKCIQVHPSASKCIQVHPSTYLAAISWAYLGLKHECLILIGYWIYFYLHSNIFKPYPKSSSEPHFQPKDISATFRQVKLHVATCN